MKASNNHLTTVLVIPVFNEAERMDFDFFSGIKSLDINQIIFIDDGSTDRSFQIIDNFFAEDSRVQWIHNSSNVGKAESLRLGILRALEKTPVLVIVTDADGAISHLDIVKMVAKTREMLETTFSEEDIILTSGARVNLAGWQIQRTILRQWIGRVIATVVALICKTSMYDTQSPLKVLYFSNKNAGAILVNRFKTKWFYEAELVMRINNIRVSSDSLRNSIIHEFPLTYFRDIPGGKLKLGSAFSVFKQLCILYFISKPYKSD
jgi:dolichyl-phosphate beta-glucosyltransferase